MKRRENCKFKAEKLCRDILQAITGEAFPKCRPAWLVGDKGRRLELDGYCPQLGVAFEYQGEQHYKWSPLWHGRNRVAWKEQARRDRRKLELCEENWVSLIVIPYTVSPLDVFEYLRKEAEDLGVLRYPY